MYFGDDFNNVRVVDVGDVSGCDCFGEVVFIGLDV